MTNEIKPLKWAKKDDEGIYRSLDGRWEIRPYKHGREKTHQLVDLEREAHEGDKYLSEGFNGVRYLKEQAAYETAIGINLEYEQAVSELEDRRSEASDRTDELQEVAWRLEAILNVLDKSDADAAIVGLQASHYKDETISGELKAASNALRSQVAEFLQDSASYEENRVVLINAIREVVTARYEIAQEAKNEAKREEDNRRLEISAFRKTSFRDYKIAQYKREDEIQRLRWQVEELRRSAETDNDREYAEAAAVQLAELESR